jgi:Short C-terminal domain/Phospholipase_D-nuclease N-terminal
LKAPTRQGDAMPLASTSYSYPLLGAFWTIFEIFLWVIWFWILITVFIDIFRSRDLSGWAKALWFIFVLFIPLIGVLVYLIVRGGSMHERAAKEAQQQDQEFRSYVQEAASSGTPADQLAKLADLRDRGVISAEEFEREKAKILA